ncbi:MAG: YdcH family protein [Bosea sp. (in: a-proteobacteria)]
MSLQTHLVELEKKHKALESALASALAHPSASDVELAEMKRKKLQLKDEIVKLRASISAKVTLH